MTKEKTEKIAHVIQPADDIRIEAIEENCRTVVEEAEKFSDAAVLLAYDGLSLIARIRSEAPARPDS